MLVRWKLTIEYNGLPFNGWQSQKDKSGVQDFLLEAIKNFSNEVVAKKYLEVCKKII